MTPSVSHLGGESINDEGRVRLRIMMMLGGEADRMASLARPASLGDRWQSKLASIGISMIPLPERPAGISMADWPWRFCLGRGRYCVPDPVSLFSLGPPFGERAYALQVPEELGKKILFLGGVP